jgi:ABC-2 type transport system ATP-binding protein
MLPAVSLKNASFKIRGKTILNRINLEIEKNKITGILGLNGAGKTSLLSLINGLHSPTSGEVKVSEERSPFSQLLRRNMGIVLQETALYEELTVSENLDFSASLYGVKNAKRIINETLTLLDMKQRKNQTIETLSGGLKRRVAIARALIHDPNLLIIDEPTLGVDAESRHIIWGHLRMLRSRGKTIILASNYLDEIEALCDTVAILKEGRLINISTPKKLIFKTGICIDIQCSEKIGQKIFTLLKGMKLVSRVDKTLSGLSLFVRKQLDSKKVIKKILSMTEVDGLTTRAPDLAEVFKSIRK